MKRIIYLVITTVLLFSVASAQTIDPTFGTNGVVVNEVTSGVDALYKMALQPDGKITAIGIANGKIVLSRYLSDGSLDATFGTSGIKTTTFSCNFGFGAPVDIQLQSDNKILILGRNGNTILLARYETNGAPDTTFGTNGIVSINDLIGANNSEYCRRMRILDNGKIMILGNFQVLQQLFMARYNSNGSVDTSFGTNGFTTFSAPENYHGLRAVDFFQQSDHKIIVGISAINESTGFADFGLIRFQSNGQLDSSFATDGFVFTHVSLPNVHDIPNTLKSQSDGKILLAGSAGSKFAVVRYNTNGSLDATFNTTGIASVTVGGAYRECTDIAVEPNGKMVLAGYIGDDFASVRYKTDGTLDTAYGTNGVFKIDFGTASYDYGSSIIRQPDGKFVMAGWTSHFCSNRGFALTRFSSPNTGGDLEIHESTSKNSGIICYPNPTNGQLSLRLPETFLQPTIIIRNIVGQEIMNETFSATNNIDLILNVNSGVYTLEAFENGKTRAIFKIVKQ